MTRNRVWDKVINDWTVAKNYISGECKYDKNVLKRIERYAFQQLDGINHSDGYYRLDDYVYFEYKGKMIFDPWQNEKFQYGDCIWVEYDEFSETHQGEHVVDPFEYYGADAMNDFVERMLRQVEGI